MATVNLDQLVSAERLLKVEADCADCHWRQSTHHRNNRATGVSADVVRVHGEIHAATPRYAGHRVTITTVTERAVTAP